MLEPALYSIEESRKLLGGISRNTIYALLHSGQLASVLIGSRRFIPAEAIADLIERSTTTTSPSRKLPRPREEPDQKVLPLPLPACVNARGLRIRN